MRLAAWAAIAVRHRRTVILLAILTTFAGVALLIDRPEGVALEWIAPSLLVVGGSVFAWGVWPRGPPNSEPPRSVATRLLRRLTWNGRLVPFFPVFGVAIVLPDLGYNIALSATPALQTEDTIVLLAAAALLGYTLVPPRFARERDFVLVFSLCLNAILVLPLLAARAYYANFERSVDVYSWVALAPQTSAVLTLLGVSNSVHEVAGLTAPGLTFTPQHIPAQVTVVITTACSGIYSFGIFASAFVAFIMTEYETLSWRVWVLLGLGLLTAYVANVLRMVVIVLVGYYTATTETALRTCSSPIRMRAGSFSSAGSQSSGDSCSGFSPAVEWCPLRVGAAERLREWSLCVAFAYARSLPWSPRRAVPAAPTTIEPA